jgi:hypothetical protein
MTLMFCCFERQPLILRLYGTAVEIQPDLPERDERIALWLRSSNFRDRRHGWGR